MAIVNCDCITCTYNVAGECTSGGINLVDGECQTEYSSDITGEIIDYEEPGKPAYNEAYYEDHEDDELEDKYLNCMW